MRHDPPRAAGRAEKVVAFSKQNRHYFTSAQPSAATPATALPPRLLQDYLRTIGWLEPERSAEVIPFPADGVVRR